MTGFIPDRLSLKQVRTDYWDSLYDHGSGQRDVGAAIALGGLPVLVFISTLLGGYVFPAPVALLPAVSLLSGVLLAAAGQVLTMRARIDDKEHATQLRIRRHIKETMSGLILTSISSLLAAIALGGLAAATVQPGFVVRWWHVALSSASLGLTTLISLMFVVAAKRLYTTYLEVFEDGPRPKRHQRF
ncbi:hypothetical protein ACTHQY_09115 [Rhodococcoides corynebacterioides]|uniref:hypothetical protein n=1 Tax=Rhodococcoides corynebacterioides TaxID=53972 RepID=UPI003F7FB1E0